MANIDEDIPDLVWESDPDVVLRMEGDIYISLTSSRD